MLIRIKQPMKEKIEASAVLDTFGLLCPMPIIKTAAKIREMKNGDVLKVLSDDPGVQEDLPAWCITSGNQLVLLEEIGSEFHAYIRKLR
jgi:tRNA 2-thiouridine synthesizing protein A